MGVEREFGAIAGWYRRDPWIQWSQIKIEAPQVVPQVPRLELGSAVNGCLLSLDATKVHGAPSTCAVRGTPAWRGRTIGATSKWRREDEGASTSTWMARGEDVLGRASNRRGGAAVRQVHLRAQLQNMYLMPGACVS